ncbi:MAG: DUF4007 family protein [Calditrichaeota bacterium]|nr:MAG: DUF4007 family protein [Calditrichota bacterium]
MSRFTFSGHETFHCRQLWLKKGYDFLRNNRRFTDESAVVELGVGRNMVTAIRYWLRVFELVDENDEPQEIADYLFADNGKDPYLEDIGTLWLLHYFLVTRSKASVFSLVFNEFRKERVEFDKDHLKSFIRRKCKEHNAPFNPNTISNDINVFIKTYLQPKNKTKNIEDDFAGLLIELGLLQQSERFETGSSSWYKIESKEREEIPLEIVLYSILDNEKYGDSISFNELLNGYNSVGVVYALNASGLMGKVERLSKKYPYIVFSDVAGVREVQFKERPDKWEILNQYYESPI